MTNEQERALETEIKALIVLALQEAQKASQEGDFETAQIFAYEVTDLMTKLAEMPTALKRVVQ